MTTTTTYTLRHAYEQDRESNNDPFKPFEDVSHRGVSVANPAEGREKRAKQASEGEEKREAEEDIQWAR